MARRKVSYPEKPWIRDPAILKRWQALLDKGKDPAKLRTPQPKDGWLLYRWDTLEDAAQ